MLVEVVSSQGWEGFVRSRLDLFTLDHFGVIGPGPQVAQELGIDVEGFLRQMEKNI